MRRTLSLLLAAFMLAVPSAAFAQSAGDEQYADPFGQTGQGNQGNQGDQGNQSAQEGGSQGEPAQSEAPAAAQTQSDELGTSEPEIQQTSAPTLPATGLPVGLLAGTGALLLAAGTTLRRRTS